MIDIIVNERTGVCVVHDERAVDAARVLEVCSNSGTAALLMQNGARRVLGRLSPSMYASILSHRAQDRSAMLVRMSGWTIAKSDRIDFRVAA